MIQHVEDRKICLKRIFEKHGINDINVKALRLVFPGTQNDEAFQFEQYKDSIMHQDGDVIDLQDFYDWQRTQATELDESGLFLTPDRALTRAEYQSVESDLTRFMRRSTSHGTTFDIDSDKSDQKARVIYHLHMS